MAKRILFIHSGSDLYGASRSLLRLGSRLVKDGSEVLVILPYEGPLRPELEKCGIVVQVHGDLPVVTRTDFGGMKGMVTILLSVPISCARILSVVRRFRPDIIHTNTALILSPGIVARLVGVPHIWHVREFFEEFPGLWKRYQRFMNFFAERLVCVSTPVAEQFDERIRTRKVVVIHNGFPVEEFEPVSTERIKAFKDRFGLNGHELVGVVGRIKFGRKGQDLFVKAVSLLNGKFPNARFLLIGSPFPGNEDHLKNLRVLISGLGIADSIVCTGDVEDIKAAYAALDISVLPSGQPEPFGGVVIESMALGKPVIGTKIGGTVEQIEDGRTGFLVPPNDPQALADAMEKLLIDPECRTAMGKLGYERFLRYFEFEEFLKKIMSLYTEQISAKEMR
jgi:glycosyltransferase involved in cell wall biosynthesis